MAKLKFELVRLDNEHIKFNGEVIKCNFDVMSNRYIFFSKRFIVKIDNPRSRWNDQCYDEYQKWLDVKGTCYEKNFAKIYEFGQDDFGDNYVIQERVYFSHPDEDYKNTNDTYYDRFYGQLEDVRDNVGVGDMHSENWGVVGRTVKIFDYALQPIIYNNMNQTVFV